MSELPEQSGVALGKHQVLLAVEGSTDACSVALRCESGQVIDRNELKPREHNQILLSLIEEVLNEASVSLSELDALVFGAGPGSFTGLRLVCGVVQGLGFAAGKPVIAVSSLAATAQSVHIEGDQQCKTIVVAEDARMGDVYLGIYRCIDDLVEPLEDDRILSLAEMEAEVCGYKDSIRVGELLTREKHTIFPTARAVLSLAERQLQQSGSAEVLVRAEQARPVYLRESTGWKKWVPKSATPPAEKDSR